MHDRGNPFNKYVSPELTLFLPLHLDNGVAGRCLRAEGKRLGRAPKAIGGNEQRNSRQSENSAFEIVKGTTYAPENYRKHVVSGAILMFGLYGLLAYLAVRYDREHYGNGDE